MVSDGQCEIGNFKTKSNSNSLSLVVALIPEYSLIIFAFIVWIY